MADFLGKDEKFKNLIPLRFDDYIEADKLLHTIEDHPQYLNSIQTIFHLGACSSTTETDGRYLIQNNYTFTKTLAQWAITNHKRFLYASSAATYGDGAHSMDDKNNDLTRLRPLNLYAYTKQRFDLYAQRRGWLSNIIGLKYFNIFGPNENHKGDMRSVVSKAFQQIHTQGKVNLFKSYHPQYADGEQRRDFLYIKDAVAMTLHLAETPTAAGLYNLGAGHAHTWKELVTPIFQALGNPVNITYIDMPQNLRSTYQYYTCADIAKLRDAGYKNTPTPLDEAIKEYVTHYLIPQKHLGDEQPTTHEP